MDLSNIILLAAEQAVEHGAQQQSVIGTLGLNWKLFLAQALNFSIVLFVLWRWVFRPVAGALESRRQRVEESVRKAEAIEKQMTEADELRAQKLREAGLAAEAMMKKHTVAAEKMKAEIIQAAHAEAEKTLARTLSAIEAEKQQMLREVRAEAAELIVLATEKILSEKIDEKKDRELINRAVDEIHR